jgi:hypothetical protein
MITVYNPLTGQWERLDDVVRPLPVVARDTRLVAANDTTPFVPSLGANNSQTHTDILGNTDLTRANIGIAVGSTSADFVVPDTWRIRRIIVICNRSASGTTNVAITCALYGRLLAPDGTPTGWRSVASASDSAVNFSAPIRFLLPSTIAGVQAFDQYRITFRRDPDSTPQPELSLIRVYAEF